MTYRSLCRRVSLAMLLAGVAAPASARLDLSTYQVTLQRGLDFDEASGVTYNWDKNVLFLVDDEGDDLAEYSLTGNRLTADTIPQLNGGNGGYRDIEGVTYIGNGRYVLAEERTEEMVLVGVTGTNNSGAVPRSTYTAKPDALKYAVRGGTNVGNNGLEGVSFDPLTGNYFGVRQGGTSSVSEAVYFNHIDFGSPTTGTTSEPFNPAPLGLATLSDIAALSTNPNFAGTDYQQNLLILSADASTRRLLEVSRTGELLSSFDLSGLAIQTIEGVTLDFAGNIYLVGETGGVSPSFSNPGTVSTSGLVVLSRAVSAVPEPSTWAMMVGGLGLVGGALRRRAKAARTAFARA